MINFKSLAGLKKVYKPLIIGCLICSYIVVLYHLKIIDLVLIITAPGIDNAAFLLKNSFSPWQMSLAMIIFYALGFILVFTSFYYPNWKAIKYFILVSATLSLSLAGTIIYESNKKRGVSDWSNYGYSVVEYSKTSNQGERTLTFFGVQHLADLGYYKSLSNDLIRLATKGNIIILENSDADEANPDLEKITNNTFYGKNCSHRFFIDLLRQPYQWPYIEPSKLRVVDLTKSSPEILAIPLTLPLQDWWYEMNNARDNHLLREIENSEHKDLTVVYGLNHLDNLSSLLAKSGWKIINDPKVFPDGRKLPPNEANCSG